MPRAFDADDVAAKHFGRFKNACRPGKCSNEQYRDALEELIDLAQEALGPVKAAIRQEDV